LTFAEIAAQEFRSAGEAATVEGSRKLYFGPVSGSHDTPVIERRQLGDKPRRGPLVIEEPEATIVVPPDFTAQLDRTGSVVLTPDARP
jgi:N-methylhydantoinase A